MNPMHWPLVAFEPLAANQTVWTVVSAGPLAPGGPKGPHGPVVPAGPDGPEGRRLLTSLRARRVQTARPTLSVAFSRGPRRPGSPRPRSGGPDGPGADASVGPGGPLSVVAAVSRPGPGRRARLSPRASVPG